MNPSLRILYVGALWKGATSLQRMEAVRELGHSVIAVDSCPEYVHDQERRLINRIRHKLFGPWDASGANRAMIEHLKTESFDVIWLDKALTIKPATLAAAKRMQPRCRIAGYSPDDMAARHNQSGMFVRGLPLYDIYFTTKSYGVPEIRALGCPRVEFIGNAYDRNIHRPVAISDEIRSKLGGPVGFIGDYELDRTQSMTFLAKNGIPVRVWGPNWHRCTLEHENLKVEHRAIWADDYTRALCAFDINLCFLRRMNRDRQTQRTMEIPACGAFMLAERTEEHLALFEEGKEAEYFSSDQELLDKTRYYLDHPDDRSRIAAAGRQRCLTSGYSNHDRLFKMLEIVRELPT